MNAENILFAGHRSFMRAIRGLDEPDQNKSGLCGIWSAKDVIAHLASYELVISEVLGKSNGLEATPTYDRFQVGNFNDAEVEARQSQSYQQVLDEYKAARQEVSNKIKGISLAKLHETDSLKWFGREIDLEDFIVIVGYGHKREHAAQFNAFKDQLKAQIT